MKTRLRNLAEWLRTTYWVVPGAMLLGAALLAGLMVGLDSLWPERPQGLLGWLLAYEPQAARDLLATIAGSMITVAGVVFSITIVALSLTTSQFGPRLLNNYIRDVSNQFALGTFTATFLYCLLVLRVVRDDWVPHLAVTLSLGLAIGSLCVLIYFIHHVAASIRASHVISLVGDELRASIERLCPEPLEENDRDDGADRHPLPADFDEAGEAIAARHGGYLQAIDLAGLVDVAEEHGLTLRSEVKPGDFIVPEARLVTAYPPGDHAEELAGEINACYLIGRHRTTEQDIRHPFNQLAEVAIRALSPGINDPFTAMTCIDWLTAALCDLAGRRLPPRCHYHEDTLRLIVEPSTFAEILEAAYSQIRHYGRDNRVVIRRLIRSLGLIAERAVREADLKALAAEARALRREALTQLEQQDGEEDEVKAAYHELMKRLEA